MDTEQHILPGGEIIEKCWYSSNNCYLPGADPYLLDGEHYTEDELYDYVDANYSHHAVIELTDFIRTLVD